MKYMIIYDALKINKKIAYFEIVGLNINTWNVSNVCVHR
jgi:hypothetical protein